MKNGTNDLYIIGEITVDGELIIGGSNKVMEVFGSIDMEYGIDTRWPLSGVPEREMYIFSDNRGTP